MFDIGLMVEVRQQVQTIENKLGATRLYAANLNLMFSYSSQHMHWQGQIGLPSLDPYNFNDIEMRILRYILDKIRFRGDKRLDLGEQFDGAAQSEIENEIKLVLWRGDRFYRTRSVSDEYV